MTKKNIVQKFISFESNGKDFANLNKYISQGWYISETAPHPKKKNVFFCLLNKEIKSENDEYQNLTVKDVINLIQNNKVKPLKDIIKVPDNFEKEYKSKRILEDA